MKSIRLVCLLAVAASALSGTSLAEPLLQTGDRVALIGGTLVERARLYGYLETTLQLAAGLEVKDLTIRNLGWSGDTVFGDARSYFSPPEEGRERLRETVARFRPTVIILVYGTGEAMSVEQGWTDEATVADRSAAGLEASLALFVEGYSELISSLRRAAGSSLRETVLCAPPPLENLGLPLPDQSRNNKNLAAFRDAIRQLAKEKSARFVDLFAAMGGAESLRAGSNQALTNNGVHYSEVGYRVLARELAKELGYAKIDKLDFDRPEVENLRSAIVEKNRLFFHRWRPANETYLFLFRKHEQGQNAQDVFRLDPLIAEQEGRIVEAREAVFAVAADS